MSIARDCEAFQLKTLKQPRDAQRIAAVITQHVHRISHTTASAALARVEGKDCASEAAGRRRYEKLTRGVSMYRPAIH